MKNNNEGCCKKTADGIRREEKINVCCDIGPDGKKGTNDDISVCKKPHEVPICEPISIDSCKVIYKEDWDLCKGLEINTCCPKGTCSFHLNGAPFCNINIPEIL